ncbi:MAG: alpha/beta fold hydrolase [Oligoflexus sp.]
MVNLAELYPFQSKFLPVGDWRYHYVDEGQGEPLLMIHGNPSWSFLYRDLIRAFADRYRTIAPDHIGCGFSDKPSSEAYPYRLERRVADLESFIDQLQLKNITLVVHDWGGMIGLACAVRRPELFRRLILFNTAAFPKPASKRMPWTISLCRQPLLGPLLVQGFNAFGRGAAKFCTVRPLNHQEKAGFLYPYQNWDSREAIYEFVRDIPLKESDPSYELLQETAKHLDRLQHLPTLIMWGEKDFVFDQHFLNEWRRRLPKAEVVSFPQAGHYVIEDAKQDIIARMEQFLRAHPSGTDNKDEELI